MNRNVQTEEAVKRLVAFFAPEKVYLFGSTARGEDRPDSDLNQKIEIAVRPGVSPRLGAEKVDADRAVELDQPPRPLFDRLLFCELNLHGSTYRRFSEVIAVRTLPAPLTVRAATALEPEMLERLCFGRASAHAP